ncbi:cation diffusion facilitator family transporter [Propionibacterium sp. oral taxon 192 str. F0372]|uniref:cation diffusion facilitator family transporter n=1 Tax=Propionibacterium sp. oral taxon 192 TaxID=671222 RepID=UPI000354235A|nr:cation diffusion facilitator family transporter [Propionibacterium sp. oral taxon 192]EPH05900.1 cation diffusion facilitator family transporter [Propionibacterium sp. oral taxon 192 str. F0372]
MHDHEHHHDHNHGAGSSRPRLAVALGITLLFFTIEVVGALLTGSLAVLVDAAHMLTDSAGLIIALVASHLATRPASSRRTWGWHRVEVIAAFVQAGFLSIVGLYAVYEAIHRLIAPPEVAPGGLALIGVAGLLANLASLLVLAGGRNENLNMRAAFLEVANDALGSIAVLVAAVVIQLTGWTRADAVAALLVAALIVPRAIHLLKASGEILLESTPEGLDLDAVREHMLRQPHVVEVHDLHASTVATGLPTLTCHVVLDDSCFTDGHAVETLAKLQECVRTHHGVSIEHATFQMESAAVAEKHSGHLHA